MTNVSILIDGGHLRVLTRHAGYKYVPGYIEKTAHAFVRDDERLLRILYYDCAPYKGRVKLPVSGEYKDYQGSDAWLLDLAGRNSFAVRYGVLKFRGFRPKKKAVPLSQKSPTDADFEPVFEQKGVDMRIGLDIANYASLKTVERIILISGDTDCVPAMKNARINGIQVVLGAVPGQSIAAELRWHSDFIRQVVWPDP